ncbi:MAG: hypothetical protein AMXMBFR64_12980 [Myxococcales bacterium]
MRNLVPLLVLSTTPALAIPVLKDVTPQSGVAHSYGDAKIPWGGGGLAIGDFDADGVPDLIVAGGESQPLRAWRGAGDLTFTEVGLGLPNFGAEKALAAADYDNDGDLDLFVAVPSGGRRLLRADGPFQFTDVTTAAGLSPVGASWDMDAQWGDLDGDGWLDLFIGRYDGWNDPGSLLFLSLGDGTFALVPDAAGASGKGFVNTKDPTKIVSGANLGMRLLDLDLDGDLDLFVANDRGTGGNPWFTVYRNVDGSFVDVTLDVMTPVQANGMGVAVADLDRNGAFDVYVTNTTEGHFLFSNHCGAFSDVAKETQSVMNRSGWGVVAEDLDQDGWEDLYVTHDVTLPPGWNALLHNQQDGTFVDVAGESDAALGSADSVVVASGDLDGDGDQDLVVLNQDSPLRILRNDTAGGHWLRVRLAGVESNRDGLGALVEVAAGGARQRRQLGSTSGYLATSQLEAHFGLGDVAVVDQVVVRWPQGTVQVVEAVAADQVLVIVEQQTGGAAPLGAELCDNGLDDDCDGAVDEGFEDLGAPCVAQITPDGCVVPGLVACSAAGDAAQCLPAGAPVTDPVAVELCGDAQDNDCDGLVDEGFDEVGAPCTVQVRGACPLTGTLGCTADGVGTSCLAEPQPAPPELCGNGLDDDCDGAVDEDFEGVGAPCPLRFGGLGTHIPGIAVCTADRTALVCRPATGGPVATGAEDTTAAALAPADAGYTEGDAALSGDLEPVASPGDVRAASQDGRGGCAAAGDPAAWLLLLVGRRRRRVGVES